VPNSKKKAKLERLPTPPESADPERDEPSSAASTTQGISPDWLSETGIDEDGDDFFIDSKDLPDWMTESDTLLPKENPPASETIPGWVTESELPEQPADPQREGDLPDWLTSVEETPADVIRTPSQELPDWLSETSAQDLDHSGLPEPLESEEEQAPTSNEESGLPDWLTKLDASGVYQTHWQRFAGLYPGRRAAGRSQRSSLGRRSSVRRSSIRRRFRKRCSGGRE
jgi:hypothetical protein